MKKQTVILLSGYLQSGKDTVGNYLVEHFNYTRFAFADILKDQVSEIYNIERSSLDTSKGKAKMYDKTRTVRQVMIDHGTEKRSQDISYWSRQIYNKIIKSDSMFFVITDWRYIDEFKVFDKNNLRIECWRINRWETPPLLDSSETALDAFVFNEVFQNKSNYTKLYSEISNVIYRKGLAKLFITDIDDTLLLWVEGFKEFFKNNLEFVSEYPNIWSLNNWIKVDNKFINDFEIKIFIDIFNNSDQFEFLQPNIGAVKAIKLLKSSGFHIVAISSCTDEIEAVEKRRRNLDQVFDGNISKIICLPLGADKTETLARFSSSIWIDDNLRNILAGIRCNHTCYLMETPWNKTLGLKNIDIFHSWKDIENLI